MKMSNRQFVEFLERHARVIEGSTTLAAITGKLGHDPATVALFIRLNHELAQRCRELASEARMTDARDFDDLDDRRVCMAPAASRITQSAN